MPVRPSSDVHALLQLAECSGLDGCIGYTEFLVAWLRLLCAAQASILGSTLSPYPLAPVKAFEMQLSFWINDKMK